MTAKELVEKCGISLYGENLRVVNAGNLVPEIKARKPEIIKYLQGVEAEKKEATRVYIEKLDKMGVTEIHRVAAMWDKYRQDQKRAEESETYTATVAMPTIKTADVLSANPVGAAYVQAENYIMASNYMKSAAGRRAMEAIMDGKDYTEAIAQMEAEWTEAATKSID